MEMRGRIRKCVPPHLLATIGGQVEYDGGEESDQDDGKNQVDGKVKRFAAKLEVKGDVDHRITVFVRHRVASSGHLEGSSEETFHCGNVVGGGALQRLIHVFFL